MMDVVSANTNNSSNNVAQSNPLSRKLKKILETRLDNDKEMIDVLKTVSTFFTENNIRSRRSLRGEIERRILVINEQFVDAFSHMIKDLENIHSDVAEMSHCCTDMMDRLSATKEQTQELITKTGTLQDEEKKVELQSLLAEAFIDKFQLQPNEVKIFRAAKDGELHPDFFKVLKKVQRIHTDVKILLRTNQQTAGLEIMEQMALQQEAAFERLYRWNQSQCRSMTSSTLDVTPMQQEAMKALQGRLVLFTYCLDEYATARRGTTVQGFIDALTRGGGGARNHGGGSSVSHQQGSRHHRPIELHAHDPVRYTGDILAWLHQAVASEKENILQLLGSCEKSPDSLMEKALGQIFEGIVNPFRVRVEQVLVAEPGTLILYKLTNLLKFYHRTITDIIGGDCSLVEVLNETYLLCNKLFFTSLQLLASKLLDKVELPPRDLSAPRTLNETLKLLREIFDTHDTSIVQIHERKDVLVQVMSHLIDPLLQMCTVSASQLRPADMACYIINCIHAIKFVLSLYEFTDRKIEMLSAQIDAHTDTLVNEQTADLLSYGGLSNVYKLIVSHENDKEAVPLSTIPALDRTTVVQAFQQFDQVASSPDQSMLQQVSLLASATLKEVVTARSRDLVANAYATVYDAFFASVNRYEPCNAKTPEQIRMLLC